MQPEPTFTHAIPTAAGRTTVVPASPAEIAASAVPWERRGLLGRLVRGDAAPTRLRSPSSTSQISVPQEA